jgi:hypothetical protein
MKTTLALLIIPFIAGSLAFAPQAEKKQISSSQIQVENTGNTITRGQLQAYKQVNAGFGQDFAFDGLKIKVTGYTCVITRKKGDAYFESVRGSLVTKSIKEQFEKVRPGDIVIITDVDAICEGTKISVDPLIRTVR